MQYLVQCTRTRVAPKNLSVMVCTGLHWISLPYMEVVQLIVQKKWNGRKRSETVGNGRKHDQAKTCSTRIFLKISISAQRRFFWRSKRVQGETVGNSRRLHLRSAKKTCFYTIFKNVSWTYATKQLLFCRAKVRSPTVSNRFPLDTFGPSKKRRCAEMLIKKKKMRVEQVLGWSCFRPFPTVSDRFRPFHFFWTINWTTSMYGRLIHCKPVQTMTLKFFGATLVRVHCTKYCILTLISNSLKITKSQELVKFNRHCWGDPEMVFRCLPHFQCQ